MLAFCEERIGEDRLSPQCVQLLCAVATQILTRVSGACKVACRAKVI